MRSLFAKLRNLSFAVDRRFERSQLPSLVGVEVIYPNPTPRKVSPTFESLPQEIHEHILLLLPDFASLENLASSCMTLWNTFIMRRKFIEDAVIRNDVGHGDGLLGYALALSRFMEDSVGGLVALLHNINDQDSSYWNGELRSGEARKVATLSRTVRELEVEFSMQCVVFFLSINLGQL